MSPSFLASGLALLAATSSRPVTFARDVAPIVFERCGPCHHPGGSAPFSLLTYVAVRQRATQIAAVTKSRFMPPWKAEPGYGEFVGQQPLTDGELGVIQQWVAEGTALGETRDVPPQPRFTDAWQLGEPDLILTLPQPYELQAEGTDVFRIFTIRLPVSATRYVRGLEFRPGNPKVVHHANIRIDRTAASRERDEQDPAPGYDGLIARSAAYPDGHFLGWTPGQIAPLLPKGRAWRLDGGSDLVVEIHMQPSGKPERVQPSIGLHFSDDPPERTPAMLRLGRQGIDIPAGARDYSTADSYVLPVDVFVQAVQPHAHYRAREVRGLATLPDGTTKALIFIKDWDFRWQHVYRYVKPLLLPKGTTLEMRFTYDNSADNLRNPQQPPQRVLWGQRSKDEMGDLWVQVLTRDERDLLTLNRDFRPKVVAEDVIGYETLIRASPSDAALHDDVALLYLELGKPREAIAHFEASVALNPESAAAQFNLGTALTLAGRLEEAIGRFQSALRIRPDYTLAHNNLGNALLSLGRLDDATGHFSAALRADPGNAAAHNNLASVLLEQGDVERALPQLREALRIDPAHAEAHFNVGRAFRRRGELSLAVDHLSQAVRLKPDWAPAMADLAWLLATAPEAKRRDADQAIRLAERAAELTGRRDAQTLDVLAAAYASAGLFERAVEVTGAALRLEPPDPAAAGLRERQELYKQHKPYRAHD